MLKLSDVDQVLVRYADTLTPQAISFKLDGLLTPEQVMARITQLVDTPDWLSGAQQDNLVTMKMRQLIVELEEMPRTVRNAEVLIRALESLGNRLDKRVAATQKDLSQLYAFQGTVMLEAINTAMTHMKARLTGASGLSEEEWDSALESALRHAQMEIGKHEQEAEGVLLAVEAKSTKAGDS